MNKAMRILSDKTTILYNIVNIYQRNVFFVISIIEGNVAV